MQNGHIGEILKQCRQKAGLSQDRLAKMLYTDQPNISRIESGEVSPAYAVVKQWAKATKCEDMISMDLAGRDSWKRFRQFEERFEKLRELVNVSFLRIKGKGKRHAVKVRG